MAAIAGLINNREVRISRKKTLETLKENREKHLLAFEQAQAEYPQAVASAPKHCPTVLYLYP